MSFSPYDEDGARTSHRTHCCIGARRATHCATGDVESESDPLTRRPIDLFEKEPLKGNSEVHLHTPTKFGEDRSKDLGGDREQTDKQTDKRCSNYSMILLILCGLADDSLTLE